MEETSCSSNGGDEGEPKENWSTLNKANATAEALASILPVEEDKGVVVEENEEIARGDLEEIPCVCAVCCCSLEKIPLTKEDDTVFLWFWRWFRYDQWMRRKRRIYSESHHGGWDGQGGLSLRFCKPCKAEVMGLMYFQSTVSKNRGPFKKQLGKDMNKLRVRMRECEPEFEAKQIYERDNRYFLLRIKFCKITTWGIKNPLNWKKNSEEFCPTKVDAEDKEEDDTPKIRMSSRVRRPVAKYISPGIHVPERMKVACSDGMEEEVEEKKDGNVEVMEVNAVAVESEPEVQVKLEEFPDDYEEDLEVDNCWFNEDCEIGETLKTEVVAKVHMPKSSNVPLERPKTRNSDKCSKPKTRGSSKRVSGPKSRVGGAKRTKVDRVSPLIDPLKLKGKEAAMSGKDTHSEENCLFCYKTISPEDIKLKRVLTNDLVEANLNTVFILRKMLHIPKSKLTSYLVNFGEPKNWIQFCRQCLSVVDEALRIQKKIEELEIKLRKLQNGMVEKINSTFESGGLQKKRKPSRPGSVPDVSRITEETRQFIYTKSTTKVLPPEAPTKPEELLSSSTSLPPPPPCQLQTATEKDPLEILEDSCDANDDHTNDHDNHSNEDVFPLSPSAPSLPPSPIPLLSLSKKRKRRVIPVKPLQEAPEEDPVDIFEEDSGDANCDDDTNDSDYDIAEDLSPLSPASASSSPPPSPLPSRLSQRRKRRVVPFQGTLTEGVRERGVNKSIHKTTSDDPLDQGNYMCPLCPKLKAMSIGKFYTHGIFHYKRQFKCSECHLYWSGPAELEKNPFNTSTKPITRKTHVCSVESLETMPEFHLGQVWKCAWCPETFNLDSERDSHEAECPSKKYEAEKLIELKFECLTCPDKKCYRSHEEWLLHRVLKHPKICETSCLYCDETFKLKTIEGIDLLDTFAEKDHVVSNHPTKNTTFWEFCVFCGVACKRDRADDGYHMRHSHGLGYRDVRYCTICHFRCGRNQSLRRHVRLIHALNKFPKEEEILAAAKSASTKPYHQSKSPMLRIRRAKAKLAPFHNPQENDNDKWLQRGDYFCSFCSSLKKPMSLVQFYGHVIFHHKRQFKCSECNLYWSSLAELEKNPFTEKCVNGEHICSKETVFKMAEFQPGNIWKCAGCPETFSKDSDRDLHEETDCPNNQIKSLEYTCLSCCDDKKRKAYRSYEEWLLHRVLEHTETAITSCLFCDEKSAVKTTAEIDFFDQAAMRTHVSTEHPSCVQTTVYPVHICDFCGFTSKTNQDLRSHVQKLHGVNESNAVSCRICCYRTNRFAHLKKHVKRKHAAQRERVGGKICDVCGMKLYKPGLFALADHKLLKHGIEYPEDEEFQKRIKACQVEGCGYRSLQTEPFRVHMMKMHGAERSHKCDICGKGFLGSGKLAVHLKIHQNKETKPYQCEICGNSFALRNYLYIHMRLSHLNRPFASTHKKKPSRKTGVKRMNRDAGVGPASQSPHHSQATAEFPSQSAPVPCSSTGNVFMDAFTTFPFKNI